MTLAAGARVGPYEIVSAIGADGMGEVYRARDTKLGRDVALKLLPNLFAADPERLARFQREAQVLASLNHPHIAQIYGLEDSTGASALVMELVEGETLAERMGRSEDRPLHDSGRPHESGRERPSGRSIPVEEALAIARQIADALEAAHDKGIIHRDLKPANVMIAHNGVVKVLDFGLAAVAQASGLQDVDATHSPTLTMSATRAGVIFGTAGYMSPEQAAGKTVDKRADIWSFGVMLWEMLAGRRLFDGETVSHTLADVLAEFREGAWSTQGVILFGVGTGFGGYSIGLTRVSEAGGPLSLVTRVDASRQEVQHSGPTFLTDGRTSCTTVPHAPRKTVASTSGRLMRSQKNKTSTSTACSPPTRTCLCALIGFQ